MSVKKKPKANASKGQILKHTQVSIYATLKHFNIKIPEKTQFHPVYEQNCSPVYLLHIPRLPDQGVGRPGFSPPLVLSPEECG